MPSAAWITASKRTPMEPVFYAACESVDAINVTQNLASDWNAGTMDNVETFDIPGGGAGLRPKLYTYNKDQVNWWEGSGAQYVRNRIGGFTIAAPTIGFIEHVTAIWNFRMVQEIVTPKMIGSWPVHSAGAIAGSGVFEFSTDSPHRMVLLNKGQYLSGATVPFASEVSPAYNTPSGTFYGSVGALFNALPETPSDIYWAAVYPGNDANFQVGFRAKAGTITTKTFDLGTVPNINSRVFIEDMVAGASSIAYVCEGSETGTGGWVSLGTVSDGREVAPYRYYRFQITFTSTGYDTPELYSIRVVGGNRQMVYLGTHRGEPALPSGEVAPYLQKVSTISSKISLKDKPTVGDLTLDLLWMPLTSDLVQSTGKRRSVTVHLGFVGLPKEDYEPYFTGAWESYTGDQDKRTFTVKLRDVWKKFKKQIPEQQNNAGVRVDIYHQFGQSPSGSGTPLNIIDAMVQVADLAKAPDRFIDRAEFAALKAAHYSGQEWNVYRVLTDQKDSDDLLKELAVTAGLFLVPYPNGKLTPLHYETLAAGTPAVTLDAAQIKFTNLTPDMAETVTRHNIYFNLIEDSKGRRSGGTAADYSHVYTTLGSTNSVIAERDREEVVTGEWFDNWGLAAGVTNGIPNPLTQLADRLESWYTPVANVGGKDVSTTKVSVKAENVPLRYWSDVMPGCTVMVDNLRLPCPIASWEGFSNQVKFLVLARNVDPKNFTLSLDLFQIAPLTYNPSPTWNAYDRHDLFPAVSLLTLTDAFIPGADGIARPAVSLSFVPPSGYTSGSYEIWVSEGGATARLYTAMPATGAAGIISLTLPVQTGVSYTITVVTVTGSGARPAFETAPSSSITAGSVAEITAATLQLLNPAASADRITDYLTGTGSFTDVLDTYTPAAQAGVGQEGVFATKGQILMQADKAIQLKAGSEDVNAKILLLEGQIQLKASTGDLSAQVDILSDAIGLKLNASGTVGPGMLISWTDETHTRSVIDFATDTLRVSKPDGTGVKQILTVGTVNGVSTVGINAGDLVVDGSILARHIAVDQLVVGDNVTMGPNAYIAWGNVQSKPTFATVATSGSYSDLANKPTIPTVPSYITSTKITATTIESPTISAGTFTGSVFILGDGTTYGKIETYDFANRATGIQILDGATPVLNVKGGTLSGSTITVGTGDGTTAAAIGGHLHCVGSYGGVLATTYEAVLVDMRWAGSGTGLSNEAGIRLINTFSEAGSKEGILLSSIVTPSGSSSQCYAGLFGVDDSTYAAGAPIVIKPAASSGAPTHPAKRGSLWVTSAGVLYINSSDSTTWQKVGSQ